MMGHDVTVAEERVREPFAKAYQALKAERAGDPEWVKALRQQAYESYVARGLPTRRDEEWKYTSLRPLLDMSLAHDADSDAVDASEAAAQALATHVGPDEHVLVVVNGVPSLALSRLKGLAPGVTLVGLSEALSSHGDYVRPMLEAEAASTHPFALLSAAFAGGGIFVHVAPRVELYQTLHVLHVVDARADTSSLFFPRTVVRLEESASARVVETFVGPAEQAYAVIAASHLSLSANAGLAHACVQLEGRAAVHVGRTHAVLQRDARLSTFNFASGARLGRRDLAIDLLGSGAEADLDGLYVARGQQHIDHHTTVDHRVPAATSRQLYKGILTDAGRAVFNGKVLVRQDAQGTSAFQLNRNLLLSQEAEIDTKPELQIDADDVKCSHGATVGQLDQDEIFYLMSRGLKRDEAEHMLSRAFADEVLLKVAVPGLMERLRTVLTELAL